MGRKIAVKKVETPLFGIDNIANEAASESVFQVVNTCIRPKKQPLSEKTEVKEAVSEAKQTEQVAVEQVQTEIRPPLPTLAHWRRVLYIDASLRSLAFSAPVRESSPPHHPDHPDAASEIEVYFTGDAKPSICSLLTRSILSQIVAQCETVHRARQLGNPVIPEDSYQQVVTRMDAVFAEIRSGAWIG